MSCTPKMSLALNNILNSGLDDYEKQVAEGLKYLTCVDKVVLQIGKDVPHSLDILLKDVYAIAFLYQNKFPRLEGSRIIPVVNIFPTIPFGGTYDISCFISVTRPTDPSHYCFRVGVCFSDDVSNPFLLTIPKPKKLLERENPDQLSFMEMV